MSGTIATTGVDQVVYPDSDGEPIAENTLQFRWIVTIQGGLDALFRDDPDVFVAGDLLWYPVEGDNKTRMAPDVLVAFGRPKGYRGSYRQWDEAGVAPQVVFEILSPGNRPAAMGLKFDFYERFGVDEYYLYDPDSWALDGWVRDGSRLKAVESISGWTSPRLGIRFEIDEGELEFYGPNGQPFATYVELAERLEESERHAAAEQKRAAAERERADQLEQKLRELGIDPDEQP